MAQNSWLTEITIPGSVAKIGDDAFPAATVLKRES